MAQAGERTAMRLGGIILRSLKENNQTTLRKRALCALASQPASRLLQPQNVSAVQSQQERSFFKLPNPLQGSSKRLEYSERRILGYSMEQMYSIVAAVEDYSEFVPWCSGSRVHSQRPGQFKCHMTIGFPPIQESYTSHVTVVKSQLVRSESIETRLFSQLITTWAFSPGLEGRDNTCTLDFTAECKEGQMFNYLLNNWQFAPGLPGVHHSCTLDFQVAFEFRNRLHSHLARAFFDQVVKTMVNAFLKRAQELYGPQSIAYHEQKKQIINYTR
ncbi:hypothetical protein CAPTEDRAFT_154843 [Capitella teleta]|uniref:Coenzyme Q-binding protein COQ10 START domain-containing protein n=1 Tax=Capitella teleta TaxID=283909 RepID=R7VL86_CAPTE|nr:hypothetical protein CAPTEDRAFT_154843 [Capitella teleta]|eukprot:ELU18046.1 hypothetical protein CAPTEDRAFT_154843 [Capitella teleta]